MTKKKLELIPWIEAIDFPHEVEEECRSADISTHCDDSTFYIDWKDSNSMPLMQAWLIETYGKAIRKRDHFCIMAT